MIDIEGEISLEFYCMDKWVYWPEVLREREREPGYGLVSTICSNPNNLNIADGSLWLTFTFCSPNKDILRACSLVVSDLRSETKGFWFRSGCYLCAEVGCLLIFEKRPSNSEKEMALHQCWEISNSNRDFGLNRAFLSENQRVIRTIAVNWYLYYTIEFMAFLHMEFPIRKLSQSLVFIWSNEHTAFL